MMIRDFRVDDREEFMKMCYDFYHSPATLHGISQEKIENIFNTTIQINPYVRGLIVEQNDVIVGYAHLSFTHSNEAGGMVMLIEEVYIKPEYQGKGLANRLFDWIFDEYEGKIKRYRLEVTKVNDGAIRLYDRRGFRQLDYMQMIKDPNRS